MSNTETTIIEDLKQKQDIKILQSLYIDLESKDNFQITKNLITIGNLVQKSRNISILLSCTKDSGKEEKSIFVSTLLKLYFNTNNQINLNIILQILESIVNGAYIKVENIEEIYVSLSKFLRSKTDNFDIATMIKYIKVLKILYGEKLSLIKPKNFFYFTGNGLISNNVITDNEQSISLKKGFVIKLWFEIDGVFISNNKQVSDILLLITNQNQIINLLLKGNDIIYRMNDEDVILFTIKPKEFIFLTISLKPKTLFSADTIHVNMNGNIREIKINHFNSQSEIVSLYFFKNFYGRATTILYFRKYFSFEGINFAKDFPLGIYNEKLMIIFLRKIIAGYFQNSSKKFKSEKLIFQDLNVSERVLKAIKIFLIPTRCDHKNRIYNLDKLFNGVLMTDNKLSGVHIHKRCQSRLWSLGGIRAIVPIFEICHIYEFQNEQLITSIFEMILSILSYHRKNIIIAQNAKIFSIVSVLLQKFDGKVFGRVLLNVLIELGKCIFSQLNSHEIINQYFTSFLLNPLIFSKFPFELQLELLSSLNQLFISDVTLINRVIKINFIILILRRYDRDRLVNYCCNYHMTVFDKEVKGLMIPVMDIRIQDLMKIAYLIILHNPSENYNDFQKIFQLLCLDISPCMYKNILILFIVFIVKLEISY